ncbi:uncharacterized protein SAPINGB_P000881 [Magnusiomyces paraingens]|uniref:PABS domain-containing protein n=1 Tax=Magnusiomyces paraingens TaxID=2606893 RepID=A0A5E8B920_9ASCO|nr:uncharacterized protein SAPINGB_P000881 [Saprochaete ingens]VVT45768.1 unnamed protein product [Saprochaete ingens]
MEVPSSRKSVIPDISSLPPSDRIVELDRDAKIDSTVISKDIVDPGYSDDPKPESEPEEPSFWETQLIQILNYPELLLLFLPMYLVYLYFLSVESRPFFGNFSQVRVFLFIPISADFVIQLHRVFENRYNFNFPRISPLILLITLWATGRIVNQVCQASMDINFVEADTRQGIAVFLSSLPFTIIGGQTIFLAKYERHTTSFKQIAYTYAAAFALYFIPISNSIYLSLIVTTFSFIVSVYRDVYVNDTPRSIAVQTTVAIAFMAAFSGYYMRPPARSFLSSASFPYSSADQSITIWNSTDSISGKVIVGDLIPSKPSAFPQKKRKGGPEQDYDQPIRFLRIDHSLIGGIWMPKYPSLEESQSIYSAFYLQEISQYVVPPPYANPNNKSVILLGVGIGASAKGFEENGYTVDLLELDPAIYENAVKYFGLNPNYHVQFGNALDWIYSYDKDNVPKKRYSVINHDFFSGENGDSKLFEEKTFEIIKNKILEKDTGVLTVNVYGSPNDFKILRIYENLQNVFNQQCDMYHDKITDNMRKGSIYVEREEELNLVFLCRQKFGEKKLVIDDELINKTVKQNMRGVVLSSNHVRKIPRLSIIKLQDLIEVGVNENDSKETRWRILSRQSRKHWNVMDKVLPRIAWAYY